MEGSGRGEGQAHTPKSIQDGCDKAFKASESVKKNVRMYEVLILNQNILSYKQNYIFYQLLY